MRAVVITGGTRGLGFGMAQSFLKRGCAVTISGRTESSVQSAVAALAEGTPGGMILGRVADVASPGDTTALWEAAAERFGHVDLWVNNAAIFPAYGKFSDRRQSRRKRSFGRMLSA